MKHALMMLMCLDIEHPGLFDCTPGEIETIPFIGPTWIDDLSVCICATSNQALLAKTGIALSILIGLCQAAHMHPNLKKGKTEVMFHFQGCGSRALRRRFYSETCEFPVVCENATHHISVVSRYLHLGGILHHRTVTCAEITRRLGIALLAFTQHRRILYRSSQIAWKKRQEMFPLWCSANSCTDLSHGHLIPRKAETNCMPASSNSTKDYWEVTMRHI